MAAELLDPEFTEVGKSGSWWDRPAMLAALPKMTPDHRIGSFATPSLCHEHPAKTHQNPPCAA